MLSINIVYAMHGAQIPDRFYIMSIGGYNSIGTTLTIITFDAYQETILTGMWSVPFVLNIVSEYIHVSSD